MNKKLFLGMFAAAGMLFATSCSNDELDAVQSGNEAQVTFSLGLEGGIATRAISDGTGAKKLVYAVYKLDADGNPVLQKVVGSNNDGQFVDTEAFDAGLTETVSVTLAKGQTYQVAFWAQNPNCTAYTTTDLESVTIDYDGLNNDETRDAFFKTVEFTVTGSTSIDVELKRPFAQINVGVTEEADWDAAVASGITVAQSSVVIKNAATKLNLLDGTVSDETEVSYELANIPSDPAILQVDTDGDGIKEDYNWLSMSYILVADEIDGASKATLQSLQYTFTPENGNPIEFKEGLNTVPVQRNWRTNIVGKILTGDITFNIVIDEEFEDDHNVKLPYATIGDVVYKSFAEAMAAVKDGETIKLEGETTLDGVADGNLFTIEGKSITIDLNGYGFVATVPDVTKNSSIFYVAKNSGLTIEGEGNVKVTTNEAPNALAAFINNVGGTVNLKGGNWTMTALEVQDALIPTFVDNNSTVNSTTLNIYDGTYTFHRNLFRNFANGNTNNAATINIYGGTFNGRESDAGAIWNQRPSENTPDGAGIINVMGGTFNNVNINDDFGGVVYVNNQEELNNALANANTHTVMLGDGTYDMTKLTAIAGKTLTFVGAGENTIFDYSSQGYNQYVNGGSGTFVFKNMTIQRSTATFAGMAHTASTSYENCTITGTYYVYETTAKFTDCKFNVTGDFYNCWLYGTSSATYEKCEFNCSGKSIYVDGNGEEGIDITTNTCVFNDKGGVENKAAIETGNTYGKRYSLTINNTTVNGFSTTEAKSPAVEGAELGTNVWGNKNYMTKDKLSVTIDGAKVY